MKRIKRLSLITIYGVLATGSLSAQITFTDDFDGPDFEPGWTQYNNPEGTWDISNGNAVPSGLEPDLDTYRHTKLLVYEGQELPAAGDFQPFRITSDMAFTAGGRWGGIAFHVQDPGAEEEHNVVDFYSMIVREGTHSGGPAVQMRRYFADEARPPTRDVLQSSTALDSEHLHAPEFFRYTVESDDPGVFVLTIEELEQETREVLGTVFSTTVENHDLTGGFAGFHSDSNEKLYDNFELTIVPEPSTVTLFLGAAVFGVAFFVRRRKVA